MIKKFSAFLLAFTIAACSLAGCANSESDSSADESASDSSAEEVTVENSDDTSTETEDAPDPSLTIDGEEIDTTDYIMCTIDGTDINFDEFRFYYYYNLDKYTSTYGVTMETLAETDGGFEMFMDDVILCIKQELVAQKLADENGLALDDDDMQTVEDNIASAKSNYETEEDYLTDLKNAYLTEDLYVTMLERAQIYTKVMDTLFSNDGIYATSRDDFREIIQDTDEYAREIHVMIPYYAQVELDDSTAEEYDDMTLTQKASAKQSAYYSLDEDAQAQAQEDAKALAQEVLAKANDGEDFEKLIEEYGWDTGLEDPTYGYYINKGNTGGYPEELIDEAFALGIDEISTELVENTTYGFFIVKRLEVDMDYVEEYIDEMISSYDEPAIEEIYTQTMEEMTVEYCADWDKLTPDSIT